MAQQLESVFLDFSSRKLEELFGRIRECLSRLTPEQVWARGSEAENAIGNLILHLNGNVRQWIVSGVGGRSNIRVREREFTTRGDLDPADLIAQLEQTLSEASAVLSSVTPRRLAEGITVQDYQVSVLEAIYHVVEHFSQHTGQIIFATKVFTGADLGFYRHLSAAAQRSPGEKTP